MCLLETKNESLFQFNKNKKYVIIKIFEYQSCIDNFSEQFPKNQSMWELFAKI